MKNFLLLFFTNPLLKVKTQLDPGIYNMIGNIKGADGVVSNRELRIFSETKRV